MKVLKTNIWNSKKLENKSLLLIRRWLISFYSMLDKMSSRISFKVLKLLDPLLLVLAVLMLIKLEIACSTNLLMIVFIIRATMKSNNIFFKPKSILIIRRCTDNMFKSTTNSISYNWRKRVRNIHIYMTRLLNWTKISSLKLINKESNNLLRRRLLLGLNSINIWKNSKLMIHLSSNVMIHLLYLNLLFFINSIATLLRRIRIQRFYTIMSNKSLSRFSQIIRLRMIWRSLSLRFSRMSLIIFPLKSFISVSNKRIIRLINRPFLMFSILAASLKTTMISIISLLLSVKRIGIKDLSNKVLRLFLKVLNDDIR